MTQHSVQRQKWGRVGGAGIVALLLLALTWVTSPAPAGADVTTGTNPAPIAVPGGSGDGSGPASPYPSPITISGMTGTVTDVDITLTNVVHPIATDIDVLLVGPAGQNLIVMSDVVGDTGFPVNGTLTFDDQAPGPIPASGAVGTGTFQPTNRVDSGGPDAFPAPAPTPSSATAFTTFNGSNPNGTWNLYVVDDAAGDTGSIGGGWSITVTTAVVAQPGALQFTAGAFRGTEGGGPVDLTLERVGGTDGAVSVRLTTTTPATATPGTDFTPLDQVVNFADGQTTATVAFTILDDTAVEGVDETVTVALSDPTGGATVGAVATAVVTIDDNDATLDTTPIQIPAAGSGSNASPSPAAPYPASIDVTGRPSPIGGVEVTLTGFGHTTPIDVDVLLVGPTGQNVVLMSDVGGITPATGVNLTFSDAAATTIPAGGPLTTGTFLASDDDTSGADSFAAPAPTPSAATDLTGFQGTNPNGTWNLFIVDDASGDVGSIAGGWSLNFLPVPPANPGAIRFKADNFHAKEGHDARLTIRRAGGSEGTVSVRVTTTTPATATPGTDFTPLDQVVTFPAGVTKATVPLPLLADSEAEGDETVTVMLSDPTGGATLGTPATAVVTIKNKR
jgi:subtilisin-like proprotein convertase family protein